MICACIEKVNSRDNKINIYFINNLLSNFTKDIKINHANMSNDPLHGKPLKEIVEQLVNFYGFDRLAELININCFKENPSVKSSLTFLRKTDWARKKVEELYVRTLPKL